MQRYFIYLAYDGTNYHGWQIQPNGISVQECLMKALSTFLRREIEVIGAGRTDAGVHASLMVAHFDSDELLDTTSVTDKLNRLLPPDISIYRVCRVRPDTHARFDATARTYKYYVTTSKYPFNRQYRWRLYNQLNYERMNEAARILFEYNDFTSFSWMTDAASNAIRMPAMYTVSKKSGVLSQSMNMFMNTPDPIRPKTATSTHRTGNRTVFSEIFSPLSSLAIFSKRR